MTLPARMTAIAIKAPGGPEMLVPEARAVPQPGPGEILVKVAAAGVNRPDVRQRQGTYPPPKGAPDIPGLEMAGEVAALGPDVKRWKVGDKVCALVVGGGYAEYCLAYEPHALPVPARLSMVEAAAIPETFFTCWQNMFIACRREGRRLGAGARRHIGHRHHCDHAGQGVRRKGHHHRGLGRQMRGGEGARR
jgi:NADPH2:quinone reductase